MKPMKTLNNPLKTKAEVLIDQLEQIAMDQDEVTQQADFSIGDVVTLSDDGEEYVGIIEDEDRKVYQVRVYAVAGDELEPTDKIFYRYAEEIQPHGKAPVVEADPEPTEDDEPPKSLQIGDKVEWKSQEGLTKGVVKGVDEKISIEVYAKQKNEYEATGVDVELDSDLVEASEFDIKEEDKKLLIKMEGVEFEDSEKIGKFKGIGSAYGQVDLGGDTVAKGAYTQTLKHKNYHVKLFLDHGYGVRDYMGVAKLQDSDEGLLVMAEMPLEASDVKDIHTKVKFSVESGDSLGLSIGYNTIKSTVNADGTRTLNEIALEEMSITPFPMDTHARILSAKARRIGYQSKAHLWQQTKSNAPLGN